MTEDQKSLEKLMYELSEELEELTEAQENIWKKLFKVSQFRYFREEVTDDMQVL